MTCYSVQPKDIIFVKGYWFVSFAKNMGKNTMKNISKSLNSKYSRKLLDHAKRSTADAFKTSSKSVIQKTGRATWDIIGNKIADKITSSSQKIQQKIISKQMKKFLRNTIYPELRQKITDDLILE